jgi:hypothetical protein
MKADKDKIERKLDFKTFPNKKQAELLDFLIKKKQDQQFEKDIGSGCHKLIKLTPKYAIFKPCYGKGNLKYWFDFEFDMNDVILYYILQKDLKEKKGHYHLQRNISLYGEDKEMTDEEKVEKINGFIEEFGGIWTSDAMEIADLNAAEAMTLFKNKQGDEKNETL